MRTAVTLDEADLEVAVDLLLAKRGLRRVGKVRVSYSPPGADRPSDPESCTLSVEAEGLQIPERSAYEQLRPCEGPHDAEGAGRERYWDMTPEQRRAELPRILESLKPGTPEGERRFADGWMSELRRDRAGKAVGCRISAPGCPPSPAAPARGSTSPAARRARAPR